MARIVGITTQKDTKGNITKVTIDVKKHRDILTPLLEHLASKDSDAFEKEWAAAKTSGSPVEEVFDRLETKIRSWEWQK